MTRGSTRHSDAPREIPCDLSGGPPNASSAARRAGSWAAPLGKNHRLDMPTGGPIGRLRIEVGRVEDESARRLPQRCDVPLAVPTVARDDICQNARIYTRHPAIEQLLMAPARPFFRASGDVEL